MGNASIIFNDMALPTPRSQGAGKTEDSLHFPFLLLSDTHFPCFCIAIFIFPLHTVTQLKCVYIYILFAQLDKFPLRYRYHIFFPISHGLNQGFLQMD